MSIGLSRRAKNPIQSFEIVPLMGAVFEQFYLVAKAPYYNLRSLQYLLDTTSSALSLLFRLKIIFILHAV